VSPAVAAAGAVADPNWDGGGDGGETREESNKDEKNFEINLNKPSKSNTPHAAAQFDLVSIYIFT